MTMMIFSNAHGNRGLNLAALRILFHTVWSSVRSRLHIYLLDERLKGSASGSGQDYCCYDTFSRHNLKLSPYPTERCSDPSSDHFRF